MKILALFFGWPLGSIWSNLIASALWATPTVAIGWKKYKQHHDRHTKLLQDLHRKIDQK